MGLFIFMIWYTSMGVIYGLIALNDGDFVTKVQNIFDENYDAELWQELLPFVYIVVFIAWVPDLINGTTIKFIKKSFI